MLGKKKSLLNVGHLNYALNDTVPLIQTFTSDGQVLYTLDKSMNEVVWKLIVLKRFDTYLKYKFDANKLIELLFSIDSSWFVYVDKYGKLVHLPKELEAIESELQNRMIINNFKNTFDYFYLISWIIILTILFALKQPILAGIFQIHWL